MAYNPSLYSPWSTVQAQPQAVQPSNNVVFVTGLAGANALPMGPNSRMAAFDNGSDVLYFITTDGGGYKTVKEFDFIAKEPSGGASSVPTTELGAVRADIDKLAASVEELKREVAGIGGNLGKEDENA